jgi:hypothetical protein
VLLFRCRCVCGLSLGVLGVVFGAFAPVRLARVWVGGRRVEGFPCVWRWPEWWARFFGNGGFRNRAFFACCSGLSVGRALVFPGIPLGASCLGAAREGLGK